MTVLDDTALIEHLVLSRLAGDVNTTPGQTLANCQKVVLGHPDYTFGLPDWREADLDEVVAAVRAVCGGDPENASNPNGAGWIDPQASLQAILRQRDRLRAFAEAGGGPVLLATGHPTGLLPHYAAIARTLQSAGCELLTPLDDCWLAPDENGHRRGLRFLDGVACVFDGASLLHTHRSRFMEAMLDELADPPALVVGDHGMAGAAIARGITTLSIADVNDPALPLAQVRGRTDLVLPIDDNLAPRQFVPVTAAMLAWAT